ncbi:hypothetical protein EON62_00650, partial [archaeon]
MTMGEANFNDTCAFECLRGYILYPECVTPIVATYHELGQYGGVAAILCLSLLALVPAWCCFRPNKRLIAMHTWVPDTDAARDVSLEVDAYWGIVKYNSLRTTEGTCCGCCCRGGVVPDDVIALHGQTLSPSNSAVNADTALLYDHEDERLARTRMDGLRMGGSPGMNDTAYGSMRRGGNPAIVNSRSYHRSIPSTAAGEKTDMEAVAAMSSPTALPVSDLHRHLHRMYFVGTNTPFHPLQLLPRIPPELAATVLEPEFVEHTAECNRIARWRTWEVRAANALRMFYHPLALLFEAKRRAVKVRRLRKLYADYDHGFIRNTRARALGNCVRFGCSTDNTLAWIDIMVSDMHEDTGGAPVGQPRLPAVLAASGDGSFMTPYRIDLSDPYNIAQLSLIGPDFQSIIVGLNNMLRSLRGPTTACGLVLPGTRPRPTASPARLPLLQSEQSSLWRSPPDAQAGGFEMTAYTELDAGDATSD